MSKTKNMSFIIKSIIAAIIIIILSVAGIFFVSRGDNTVNIADEAAEALEESEEISDVVSVRKMLPTQGDAPVTASKHGCGNGVKEETEECDDGNDLYTDACTKFCQSAICGDGYVWHTQEQCDDGNTINGDGCSAQCKREVVKSVCGSAENIITCEKPSKNLCITDDPSKITYNQETKSWQWSCGTTTCSTLRKCQ